MSDQALRLRELARRFPFEKTEQITTGPRILAVASGKGGVGKTSLVVNLAIAIAQQGQRVVIFDADLGLANIDILLGLIPRFTLHDVFLGHKDIDDIILEGPHNVLVIPGGSGVQELANMDYYQRQRLIEGLGRFRNRTDYLIIDTGAGISRNVLGFLGAAQEVVMVVTPEPTAITDAYGIIKILSKFSAQSQIKIVVNRASSWSEAKNTMTKLERAAERFLQVQVYPLGYVREDKTVAQAVKEQEPLVLKYPHADASQDIFRLAGVILNVNVEPPRGMNHFLNRLVRLFS
jgi:flagellar biosynthesis protein FlhG